MQSGKRRHSGRRAFTLVELLVVMAIVVLLASLTVIAVAPFLKGRSLSAGARTVQGMIYQARAHAVTQGLSTTVYFDVSNQSVSLGITSDFVRGVFDPRTGEPEHLPAGVRFYDISDSGMVVTDPSQNPVGNRLVFSPRGGLDSLYMMGPGNRFIRLTDEAGSGDVRVIEVVFASGLTREGYE